jgi:DNA-binding phage protein
MKTKKKAKKTDKDREDPASEEALRLMELLQTLARVMGFSNAALARGADVSLASLNRYFKGQAEPRLDFVLAVVRAVGLEVREFFELAYPKPEAPTATYQKVATLLKPIQPGRALESPRVPEPEPGPEGVPLQREGVDKMLDDFRVDFLRELREVLEGKSP